jgi:hypothetical protein
MENSEAVTDKNFNVKGTFGIVWDVFVFTKAAILILMSL